jgi:hypothetical protein
MSTVHKFDYRYLYRYRSELLGAAIVFDGVGALLKGQSHEIFDPQCFFHQSILLGS